MAARHPGLPGHQPLVDRDTGVQLDRAVLDAAQLLRQPVRVRRHLAGLQTIRRDQDVNVQVEAEAGGNVGDVSPPDGAHAGGEPE